MDRKIMLKDVRLSYPVLGEPEDYNSNKKFRWAAVGLVPYDSPQRKAVEDLMKAVAQDKWEKKWQAYYDAIIADPKGCAWQDGKRKPDNAGYENHFALSAYRYVKDGRPLVMDRDKSPIYKPDNTFYEGKAGVIYAGCYVNMQVEFWAQQNDTGKGLRCTLLGIQFVRKGDAFGGGSAPSDDAFGDVAAGADADDLT